MARLLAEIGSLRDEISAIRAHVSSIPLLGNAIAVLQRDVRLVRAAINDMGRTNITAGEVLALHEDIDRMQSLQLEIQTRLAAIEAKFP